MEIRCTQCGAELSVASDERLIECSFCSTALVVDAEGAMFHEVMAATVTANAVPAHLRRFLGGRDTVAGLDREARLERPVLQYFPFWAFTFDSGKGDKVLLQPAAPSSLQGLQGLALPAGKVQKMDPSLTGDAVVIDPEVPASTARDWLTNRHGEVRVRKTVLYHLPLYRMKYEWKGKTYHAAVDGVTGKVFPADFPAKAEAPYMAVAVLAIIVFGLEGLIVSNIFLKFALYLVSAIPILGLAWLTSRKV
ncbi:MAG: hypothetical protein GY906_29930 [bacterium]|nr:hypothetical protein [bacterium]